MNSILRLGPAFAGRLEGALMLSVDGHYLTYIGEASPVGSNGASTSYSTGPGVNLTTTYGLRGLTGIVNPDGAATLYAVSAQCSSKSSGTPDPNKLVAISDVISAQTLPTFPATDFRATTYERFTVLQVAPPGQAFRGVAWTPKRQGEKTRQ